MKKIISIFVFAGALAWTWYLTNSTSSVAFETHAGIQVKLAEMILDVIKTKKPNAVDPEITRLWTENMDDHKIRAIFAYKFIENDSNGVSVEQTVEGEAILYRQNGETPQQDTWALQQVKTTNEGLFFSDGATITPTGEFMAGESVTPSPKEDPTQTTSSSEVKDDKAPASEATPSATPESSSANGSESHSHSQSHGEPEKH